MKSTFDSRLAHRMFLAPAPVPEAPEGCLPLHYNHCASRFPRMTTLGLSTYLFVMICMFLRNSSLDSPWTILTLCIGVGILGYTMEVAQNCLFPNLIWLTGRGIQLGWSNYFGTTYSPLIRWDCIKRAVLTYEGIFQDSETGTIEFLIAPDQLSGYDTMRLCMLYPTFWSADAQSKYFRLKFHAAGLSYNDRIALCMVLRGCLGDRKIESELREALDPGSNDISGKALVDSTRELASQASVKGQIHRDGSEAAVSGQHPAIVSTDATVSDQHPSTDVNITGQHAFRVAQLLDRLDRIPCKNEVIDSLPPQVTSIRYRPPGFLGKCYAQSQILRPGHQLVITLMLMVVFLALGPMFQLPIALSLIVAITMERLLKPTHIEITNQGLRFKWTWFNARELPQLKWKNVSHVSVVEGPARTLEKSTIVFELDDSSSKRRFTRLTNAPEHDIMYIRVDLDGLGTTEARMRFGRKLSEHLPRHTLSPKVKELICRLDPASAESLALVSDASEREMVPETVIRYKPFKRWQKHLLAMEQTKSWHKVLAVGLPSLAMLFIATQLGHSVLSLVVSVLGVAALIPFSIWLMSLSFPTHIILGQHGFRLRWRHGLIRFISPLISWKKTTYVGQCAKGNNDSYLNFNIYARDMRLADKYLLSLFSNDFLLGKDNCRLWFTLSGLKFGGQGGRLCDALKNHLPPERIDPAVLDALVPARTNSYTSLWLSSLSTDKRRVRTEPLEEGALINRYRILKQIGSGGQGIAYKAVELSSEGEEMEHVVLKEFILPSQSGGSAQQRTLMSIEREAELLRSIDHPYVVRLRDMFVEDYRCYLVLEHAPGRSLRSLIQDEGALDVDAAVKVAIDLCSILQHLHAMTPPVIHRDFTPENVIIGPDMRPKLIDFNVARQTDSTATRTVVGKHAYIPPEQFRGKASPQSDIYALGCTLHFALTGAEPEPISQSHPLCLVPSVPRALDAIIARATSIPTEERYQNASVMKDELEALAGDFCPLASDVDSSV